MRRRALAASLCAMVLATRAAAADTILVVRTQGAPSVLAEATVRLRAELTMVGFTTIAADLGASTDPRVDAEAASVGSGAAATLLLLPSPAGASSGADVWLADPSTHRTITQHVAIDLASPQAASVIALGAVELLRATRIAATVAAAQRAAEPAPIPAAAAPRAPAAEVAPPPASLLAGPHVAAGAATLVGGGGMGPAFGPLLRASYGVDHLALRVTVVAPTVEPSVDAAGGSATILRAFVEGEMVATTAGNRATWVPLASLGFGTSYLRVAGSPSNGFTGRTTDGFFFSVTLGLGLALRFAQRSAVIVDGGPSWTLPDPSVRIGGKDAAHAGSPFFRGALSVMTSF